MTSQPQPPSTPIGISDLPYMEEYLRQVLRPRVEAAIRSIEESLPETVWRQLVNAVGGEAAAANPATQAMIRSLVADRLGLQLETSIISAFGPGKPPARATAAPAAASTPGPAVTGQVVTRRPPGISSPLASAVLSTPRPPAR